MEITISELAAWRVHPTTSKIMEYIKDFRENVKEELVRLPLNSESSLMTAQAVSSCRILQHILELNYEDLVQFYDLEIEQENQINEKKNDLF